MTVVYRSIKELALLSFLYDELGRLPRSSTVPEYARAASRSSGEYGEEDTFPPVSRTHGGRVEKESSDRGTHP